MNGPQVVADPGPLRATTRRSDGDVGTDRATATLRFASPRRSLWGWGEALVIDLPAPWPDHVHLVARALDGLVGRPGPDGRGNESDGPGTGPIAFGALPFDRRRAARLVVPELLVASTDDGESWTTVVETPGRPVDRTALTSATPLPTPGRVAVDSATDDTTWCAAVTTATERIRAGELVKVVLARRLGIESDVDLDAAAIAGRLQDAHPHSLRYLVDDFVGASPELLVSRIGDVVRAHPMAGTTPRTGDPVVDNRRAAELLASDKNRVEHQITIDMVHETLLPWCSYLDAEPVPSVVPAGSVQHLATLVEGRLSHPTPSVLDLVAALHPTPAVGGWPRDAALALIDEIEGLDRGRYAGPVGWVDHRGNGAWAVGLRGVQVDGRHAELFAGVGVVADSDPAAELDETRAKFAATLGSIIRL